MDEFKALKGRIDRLITESRTPSYHTWAHPLAASCEALVESGKRGVRILEIGMGYGSRINRQIALHYGGRLTSIEENEEFYRDNFYFADTAILAADGEPSALLSRPIFDLIDVALVDGQTKYRAICTSLLLHRKDVEVVLCHDMGDSDHCYRWDSVCFPKDAWVHGVLTGDPPCTGIYARYPTILSRIGELTRAI